MVMELQLIMDTGTENLWLSNSLSSTSYHQLSHNTDNNVLRQQASLGYHPISQDALYWQEQDVSPKSSPDASRSPLNYNNHQSPENNKYQSNSNLKRRSNEHYHHQQQHVQPEKKIPRRIGPAANDVSSQGWSAQVEEIAEQFATEFDGSLSALAANDLATAVASYNMSEALLSLPSLTVFKQEAPSPDNQQNITILNHASQNNLQNGNNENNNNNKNNNNNISNSANLHQIYTSSDDFQTNHTTNNQVSSTQHGIDSNDDCRFQYILGAATSIATKVNEETLTYLNQGQSYEIKLKKLGDVSNYRGTLLKSTIRIRFHERRLQYMEREQILSWLKARPGERLLEVDVPLSYGMVDVRQPSPYNNSVEFMWDPTKEIGVYVKINCISTEFTPKKHGGEKGVPFRIEVETTHGDGQRLHIGSCQIKVFKLKGADRKHKQDRDKLQRRPSHERDKYQPSYDCTVFVDIPMESLSPQITYPQDNRNTYSPSIINSSDNCPSPIITDDNNRASSNVSSPLPTTTEKVDQIELTSTSSPSQTLAWLRSNRFSSFESVFSSYSASDILRLSRDDVIEICGLADGIRLYNLLHTKAQLTLYFTCDNQREGGLWQPVYLDNLTSQGLSFKIQNALRLPNDKLYLLTLQGPQGIHVIVNDDVVANMKDNSMFVTEVTKDPGSDCYKLLLKPSFNN